MKKRWFTLIEMLIVIVIIGILAWALIPRVWSARDKANDTAREANVRSLATAMVSYGMDHWYPTTGQATAWWVAHDAGYFIWVSATPQSEKNPLILKTDDWVILKQDGNWGFVQLPTPDVPVSDGSFVKATINSFTLDLSNYSIPDGNFNGQPTENDLYFYNRTTDNQHFVVFTMLSAGVEWLAWNCDFVTVANTWLTYDTLNAMTQWNSFCYFQ